MDSSQICHDGNEQLFCILKNDLSAAYQKIAELDLDSTDEEIKSAILSLGRSLYAYRLFTGADFNDLNTFDC
jgi:hypothetical protein